MSIRRIAVNAILPSIFNIHVLHISSLNKMTISLGGSNNPYTLGICQAFAKNTHVNESIRSKCFQ